MCFKGGKEPDRSQKVYPQTHKRAEVAVLFLPNEDLVFNEEERLVLRELTRMVTGMDYGERDYSRFILESLLSSQFNIRLSGKVNFLPILCCQDVKPSKSSVSGCNRFRSPYIGDKIIIVGKKAIGHVLFAGLSPPNMDMLNGRPVDREGKTYMLFSGVECFMPYFKTASYGDPWETLSAIKRKYLEQVRDRSTKVLREYLGVS